MRNYFPTTETRCQLTNQQGICPHCQSTEDILDDFRDELNDLRRHFGKAIPLSNAMRCPGRNRDAGGSPNSKHKLGRAADMKITDVRDRANLVRLMLKRGWSVGIYSWGIHGDFMARDEQILFRGNN